MRACARSRVSESILRKMRHDVSVPKGVEKGKRRVRVRGKGVWNYLRWISSNVSPRLWSSAASGPRACQAL
eukprot:1969628-Rhodomonas_salina.3